MKTAQPENIIYTNGNSFERWMQKVDAILIKKCGLPSDDLPDQTWALWFEDGITPRNAVEACLDDCDFDHD